MQNSPYLDKPIRTIEQAQADIARSVYRVNVHAAVADRNGKRFYEVMHVGFWPSRHEAEMVAKHLNANALASVCRPREGYTNLYRGTVEIEAVRLPA